MFTGIIQAIGRISRFDLPHIDVEVPEGTWASDPLVIGESISVDGCCLTLVDFTNGLRFDLSEETLRRTTASRYEENVAVNLERAMKASDRFGGHIVQGHVDATGRLKCIDEHENSWELEFEHDREFSKYIVQKGSISINGVSLTAVDPVENRFKVALIPHTWHHTTLSRLNPNDVVNLEFDVLAKHVEKLLESQRVTTG